MPTKHGSVNRIAMLVHNQYLSDPRVRREAEALAERGLDVHVISLSERTPQGEREPRHSIVNGVHVHRLPVSKRTGGGARYLCDCLLTVILGGLQLALLHFRAKIDVVHVHNIPDLLVLAAMVPRLGGSKLVLDVHDPSPELFMSWNHARSQGFLVRFLRLQERVSCGIVDRVVSVSEGMRENLRAKGVPDHKIFIVHNFPDEKFFPACGAPTSWPRSRDSLVLLYCGTVTEHYDLGLAVKAMARLAGEIPVKLRILGRGNQLTEVLNLASALGVRDSVEYIGLVPVDRVHDEMRKVDAGISCHQAGIFGDLQFSTKIIEYLTQGLPALSPRTHTMTRYLPEDCMFYFEPRNDAALADTLRLMWHDPAEVLRRLTNARSRLLSFSWRAEKRRFLSFYSDLIKQERHSPQVAPR